MDYREIKLEIAKAALSAGLSTGDAQQWLDWVLSAEDDGVSAGSPAAPSPAEEDYTDEQLVEELCYQFNPAHSWENFLTAIRCKSHLSLKEAICCCQLYGIRIKAREALIKAIEDDEVQGEIPYGHNEYGHTVIHGIYHISKPSLIMWLDANYRFTGTGIVKSFWEQNK